jgi:hypothetical protein
MDLLLDILPFWKYVKTNEQCEISEEKRWGRKNGPALHTSKVRINTSVIEGFCEIRTLLSRNLCSGKQTNIFQIYYSLSLGIREQC